MNTVPTQESGGKAESHRNIGITNAEPTELMNTVLPDSGLKDR